MINRYLERLDWKVNENSNMSYSLQGLNNYIASEITAQYWLQEIYPPAVKDAHTAADLHLHDLSNLSVYCCGWDIQDLLRSGFTGVAQLNHSDLMSNGAGDLNGDGVLRRLTFFDAPMTDAEMQAWTAV